MFVTDVCCRESEMYNSRETAIIGDLPGKYRRSLRPQNSKAGPRRGLSLSTLYISPFFARNAFISSFMVHRRVFFCDSSLQQNAQAGNILIFAIDFRRVKPSEDGIHKQSDGRINLLTVKVLEKKRIFYTQYYLLKMILLLYALVY